MIIRRAGLILVAVAALALLSGCAYYQLTDRETGSVYYTSDQHASWSGDLFLQSVQFSDGRTGKITTLVRPKIQTISKAEYERAIAGRAP